MEKQIAIVGGGIGGLSAALALRKRGIDATVFEKAPTLHTTGAGIVLGANAMKAFEYLGVSEDIKQYVFSTNTCRITSESGKDIMNLHFETSSTPCYTFIHRYDLIRILGEALPPGMVQYDKKLVDFHQDLDGVELVFQDGSVHKTDFVIASDGIHSAIRKKLLPYKELRFAGYTCWRGIIEQVPEYIPMEFSETWGPRGRFGIVPLSDNRIYWYALKNSQLNEAHMKAWKTKDLVYNFFHYHDPIPQIIEKTADENVICHHIYDLDPLFQYCFGNILLLGDSAHATTPNLGQGACQAVEDALYLAICLQNETTIQSAFMKYETKRLHRTRKVVQDSWLAGKVAQIDIPFVCKVRNQVLRMTPSTIHKNRFDQLYQLPDL
ncbi:FAD-dependent oxidoreductase [Cytobacillus spongiae]|uniref:FAD-dependent oxidoreductase n=1 Tax=Cytobacillus spongiae TaxID=2901381 RepID=UPI001F193380|nr:FAD-dependent oxidoreductase [Cytobacillus spongiae]UII55375.1 FAD-dependent oxidoreductase [Cytobacillus spongiae]